MSSLVFAVMRLDPDLTQTGLKTRWIDRDLFDKIARISPIIAVNEAVDEE